MASSATSPADRKNPLGALASQALKSFEGGEYKECLDLLGKVRLQKEEDSKVQHNAAVTKYLQSGCTDPKAMLNTLGAIKSKIDESKRSKDDEEENDPLFGEEYDTSLLSYNEAVVYYHLKQYATSTAILEELFCNVEPIEEGLAVKVCFLLLDNYITVHQPEKAVKPLEFLDRLATHIEENMAGKEDSLDVSAFFQQASQEANLASPKTITVKAFTLQLHLYRAKVHLLNSSLKAGKRDIKLALSANSNSAEANVLKANLEYLKANYRKSLKLLQTAYSTVQDEAGRHQGVDGLLSGGSKVPDIEPLVNNNIACIHYSMQNYNAALWYLSRSLKAAEQIAAERAQVPGEDSSVLTFSTDRKSHILYNTGMQLLCTGQPTLAFQCFQEASALFYASPRLWLRLAECCIARHVMQEREKKERCPGDPLVAGTVGRGAHHKIVLPVCTGVTHPALRGSDEKPDGDGASPRVPEAPMAAGGGEFPGGQEDASLEYGMHCARNALFFCAPPPPASASPAGGEAPATGAPPVPPSAPVMGKPKEATVSPESAARAAELEAERRRVQVAALLNLSYLALCMSSPELALSYAEQLLAVPDVQRSPKLQGHMYAAEALCILNRPAEAAQHVSPTTVGDLLLSSPQAEAPRISPTEEGENQVVVNHPVHLYCSDSGEHAPATARCHLYVNMASVFITQGELAKAEKCCQQALLAVPEDVHALQLHVYLELRGGKLEGVVGDLKKRLA